METIEPSNEQPASQNQVLTVSELQSQSESGSHCQFFHNRRNAQGIWY